MKFSALAGSLLAFMGLHPYASAASPLVHVEACWIRAMPAALPSSGYFTLKNEGNTPIVLTGAETSAFKTVALHETQMSGSTSKMVHIASVNVPAHGTLVFAPKGYHIMLEKARHALSPGTSVVLSFSFADGSSALASCDVKPASFAGR
jgi:periplasmic copper chaperone A